MLVGGRGVVVGRSRLLVVGRGVSRGRSRPTAAQHTGKPTLLIDNQYMKPAGPRSMFTNLGLGDKSLFVGDGRRVRRVEFCRSQRSTRKKHTPRRPSHAPAHIQISKLFQVGGPNFETFPNQSPNCQNFSNLACYLWCWCSLTRLVLCRLPGSARRDQEHQKINTET